MKKRKRIWERLKRLIKALEVADRMSDGKISSVMIAISCFVLMILITLYCWLFY